MFCPSCGTEERQLSQFCRVCGTDLRVVRTGLERPDTVTESAVTAREEIGRAIAARIRDVQDSKDLKKVAEHVLPQIASFLASPEEVRLKRLRGGVVASAVGLGVILLSAIMAEVTHEDTLFIIAGVGLLALLIGLSIVVNGLFLTVPMKRVLSEASEAKPETKPGVLPSTTARELRTPQSLSFPSSVTEHTTHHLSQAEKL
jgi:hypothetical protein